jgi:hypothetical protein
LGFETMGHGILVPITNMTHELVKILENVKEYCEDEAIYDKLSSYGDFYYKIIELLKKEKA